MRKQVLIKNGTIVDGTGKPAFIGNILIDDDKIISVDPINQISISTTIFSTPTPSSVTTPSSATTLSPIPPTPSSATTLSSATTPSPIPPTPSSAASSSIFVIDATGYIVSPGFIDAHTHSDAYLILEPDAPSKISQGITTEINGQCGGSIAPRYGEARLSSDWAALLGDKLSWHSLAEYREVLSQACPAVNTVQFIGHNTLRSSVIGYAPRAATSDELKKMERLLAQSLDEGGWGLTTGLIYQPGKYSTPDEVVALAKIAAAKNGFYATHMRSEGDTILESIDEVLDLVKKTGIKAEISHLKTSGKKNWHKIDEVLDKIENAIAAGLLLGSDRYPYCAAGTDLDVVLPDWAQAGAAPAETARLGDADLRARIVEEINALDRDWSTVMIGGTWAPENKPFSGKTIGEIVESSNHRMVESPGELICSILEKDGCKTGAFFFSMCEENLRKIYLRPWIVPGSDASLRAPWGPLGKDFPHPRAYATMPEFYRRVRELGFSLEATIARMTSVIADRFAIKNRGKIAAGYFADIVMIKESEFKARSTFDNPHQFSTGVEMVMVNGTITYRDSKFTGERGGRFLER